MQNHRISSPVSAVSHSALAAAIVAALSLPLVAHARDVTPGAPVILDNENASTERFNVLSGAELRLLNGTQAAGVNVTAATLVVQSSSVIGSQALRASNGSTVSLTDARVVSSGAGSRGTGLVLTTDDATRGGSAATVERSSVEGTSYGASINADGVLNASASSFTATGATGAGIGLFAGQVVLSNGSAVIGEYAGVEISADARTPLDHGRQLIVDGSSVEGTNGSAILVHQIDIVPASASITLRHGATLTGSNGTAIEVADRSDVLVGISDSQIVGDVVTDAVGVANVGLTDNASLAGRVTGHVHLSLGGGSSWTLRDTSDVASLALDAGTVFLGTADASYHALTVNGPLSGPGGTVTFNTVLNAGGAPASQQTDRLLIQGSVTTTGPTTVVVRGRGEGASTDMNGDGVLNAGEGISLIQVSGDSRRDAFALAGGYVAAGPYQYKLYAFGPGELDPSQKALAGDAFNWDYRLGSSSVCEKDCEPVTPVDPEVPVNPEDPGEPDVPGQPDPHPGIRPEVVPQVPAYLSAPAALLSYNDMLTDGIHQRLGDIREGESGDPLGGELFARYLGGQLRYTSNRAFTDFGYDFDQQVNTLQVGAGIIALDGDNGSLRAGWALDHGTTRITPHAVDGSSASKYTANGASAWVTWQHGDGLWVDGVVSGTRYAGDVSTELRGDEVGRLHATGWAMSVEAGMPFAVKGEWTVEPQFQVKYQRVAFDHFRDRDGLDVALDNAAQVSARLGLQVGWSAHPAFAPYARVDLVHTSNGDPSLDVSSTEWDTGARFRSGRVGNTVRAAAGVTSQLGRHVQLYGQGTWQHFVGGYGVRGWAGSAGIRVTF